MRAGIYININSIPTGARWVRFVNYVYFAFSALMKNGAGEGFHLWTTRGGLRRRTRSSGEAAMEL